MDVYRLFSRVNSIFFLISVPEDLSLEEREELLDIRRRKKELIDDIEVKQKKCLFIFALR